MTANAGIPAWVSEALGSGGSDVRRLPWSFTNETWAGTAPDGTRLVVTRMAAADAAARIIWRGPTLAGRLADAGLATSVPIAERSHPDRGVIVSTWLDGNPGMTRMDGADGAAVVGTALGLAWSRLRRVDATGLDLDTRWARPNDLAASADAWLVAGRADLGVEAAANVRRRIDRLRALLADRPSGFVHGDLVPANILLRESGTPAVLDLEAARVADPLFDAAWCSWIVRYHHPNLHPAMWSAFVAAANLGPIDVRERELLATLPTIRILEILSEPSLSASARRAWLSQLESSAAEG